MPVAILGVSYFGLTILLLSLLDPDYNPISQAASDYGVGRFAIEMNLGFLVGGIGLIAFAWAVGRKGTPRRSKAGSVLCLIAGLVLIMDSYFTTNIEGVQSLYMGRSTVSADSSSSSQHRLESSSSLRSLVVKEC